MQLTKKQFWLFLGSLVLVAALTCSLTFFLTRANTPEKIREVPVPVEYPAVEGVPDSYRELCEALRRYSYYGLPADTDYAGLFARAIVASTGDPYAEYMTAAEFAEYSANLAGEFCGIGASVDSYETEDGEPAIRLLAVFAGSGAEAAGLLPGDLIVGVEGESIRSIGGAAKALLRMRGEADTTVTLTVRRGDAAPEDYTVRRSLCRKKTVYSSLLPLGSGDKVAYIRITDFNTVTLSEFVSAVDAAEAAGVSGMIFDLRYNGGGYLSTVAQMLAYLLPDGDIAHIRYGAEALRENNYTISSGDGTVRNGGEVALSEEQVAHAVRVPMAVLVNGSTASAAELFTSALRDYAANDEQYPDFPPVTIVGSKTYGKGCMQKPFMLSDGSYLKVTVALYDPPSGKNYHGVGIAPTDGCAVKANDARVGDLYLKASEGDLTLPSGETDTVLARALEAFNR